MSEIAPDIYLIDDEQQFIKYLIENELSLPVKSLYDIIDELKNNYSLNYEDINQDSFIEISGYVETPINQDIVKKIYSFCTDKNGLFSSQQFGEMLNKVTGYVSYNLSDVVGQLSEDDIENIMNFRGKNQEKSYIEFISVIDTIKQTIHRIGAEITSSLQTMKKANSHINDENLDNEIIDLEKNQIHNYGKRIYPGLELLERETQSTFDSGQFYLMVVKKLKASRTNKEQKINEDYEAFSNLILRLENENENLHKTVSEMTLKSMEFDKLKEKFIKSEDKAYKNDIKLTKQMHKQQIDEERHLADIEKHVEQINKLIKRNENYKNLEDLYLEQEEKNCSDEKAYESRQTLEKQYQEVFESLKLEVETNKNLGIKINFLHDEYNNLQERFDTEQKFIENIRSENHELKEHMGQLEEEIMNKNARVLNNDLNQEYDNKSLFSRKNTIPPKTKFNVMSTNILKESVNKRLQSRLSQKTIRKQSTFSMSPSYKIKPDDTEGVIKKRRNEKKSSTLAPHYCDIDINKSSPIRKREETMKNLISSIKLQSSKKIELQPYCDKFDDLKLIELNFFTKEFAMVDSISESVTPKKPKKNASKEINMESQDNSITKMHGSKVNTEKTDLGETNLYDSIIDNREMLESISGLSDLPETEEKQSEFEMKLMLNSNFSINKNLSIVDMSPEFNGQRINNSTGSFFKLDTANIEENVPLIKANSKHLEIEIYKKNTGLIEISNENLAESPLITHSKKFNLVSSNTFDHESRPGKKKMQEIIPKDYNMKDIAVNSFLNDYSDYQKVVKEKICLHRQVNKLKTELATITEADRYDLETLGNRNSGKSLLSKNEDNSVKNYFFDLFKLINTISANILKGNFNDTEEIVEFNQEFNEIIELISNLTIFKDIKSEMENQCHTLNQNFTSFNDIITNLNTKNNELIQEVVILNEKIIELHNKNDFLTKENNLNKQQFFDCSEENKNLHETIENNKQIFLQIQDSEKISSTEYVSNQLKYEEISNLTKKTELNDQPSINTSKEYEQVTENNQLHIPKMQPDNYHKEYLENTEKVEAQNTTIEDLQSQLECINTELQQKNFDIENYIIINKELVLENGKKDFIITDLYGILNKKNTELAGLTSKHQLVVSDLNDSRVGAEKKSEAILDQTREISQLLEAKEFQETEANYQKQELEKLSEKHKDLTLIYTSEKDVTHIEISSLKDDVKKKEQAIADKKAIVLSLEYRQAMAEDIRQGLHKEIEEGFLAHTLDINKYENSLGLLRFQDLQHKTQVDAFNQQVESLKLEMISLISDLEVKQQDDQENTTELVEQSQIKDDKLDDSVSKIKSLEKNQVALLYDYEQYKNNVEIQTQELITKIDSVDYTNKYQEDETVQTELESDASKLDTLSKKIDEIIQDYYDKKASIEILNHTHTRLEELILEIGQNNQNFNKKLQMNQEKYHALNELFKEKQTEIAMLNDVLIGTEMTIEEQNLIIVELEKKIDNLINRAIKDVENNSNNLTNEIIIGETNSINPIDDFNISSNFTNENIILDANKSLQEQKSAKHIYYTETTQADADKSITKDLEKDSNTREYNQYVETKDSEGNTTSYEPKMISSIDETLIQSTNFETYNSYQEGDQDTNPKDAKNDNKEQFFSLDNKQNSFESEMKKKDNIIDELINENEKLKSLVIHVETILEHGQTQNEQLEQTVKNLRAENPSKDKDIENLQKLYEVSDLKNEDLLSKLDAKIKEYNQFGFKTKKNTEQLNEDIRKKDELLKQKDEILDEQDELLLGHGRIIKEKKDLLDKKIELLAEQDALLLEQGGMLKANNELIVQKQADFDRFIKESNLNKEIIQKKIDELNLEIETLKLSNQELKTSNVQLQKLDEFNKKELEKKSTIMETVLISLDNAKKNFDNSKKNYLKEVNEQDQLIVSHKERIYNDKFIIDDLNKKVYDLDELVENLQKELEELKEGKSRGEELRQKNEELEKKNSDMKIDIGSLQTEKSEALQDKLDLNKKICEQDGILEKCEAQISEILQDKKGLSEKNCEQDEIINKLKIENNGLQEENSILKQFDLNNTNLGNQRQSNLTSVDFYDKVYAKNAAKQEDAQIQSNQVGKTRKSVQFTDNQNQSIYERNAQKKPVLADINFQENKKKGFLGFWNNMCCTGRNKPKRNSTSKTNSLTDVSLYKDPNSSSRSTVYYKSNDNSLEKDIKKSSNTTRLTAGPSNQKTSIKNPRAMKNLSNILNSEQNTRKEAKSVGYQTTDSNMLQAPMIKNVDVSMPRDTITDSIDIYGMNRESGRQSLSGKQTPGTLSKNLSRVNLG